MSNNLIAVSTQLPDYLRELGYQDAGLSAGVTPKAPKLSVTTAKEFTITKDGQTVILPRGADGRTTVRCVLVAASGTLTKAWYEKPFVPGSNEAPDCYSNDAKVPAPGVAKPQCANCAQCPRNAFGSHPVTGRGKACGDRKLVVLVWEGDPETLMTWNVPTMSLNGLRKFDTTLRDNNIPMQSVMVELAFDPTVTYPVVTIGAVGFVDKGTAVRLRDASESEECGMLLREADYEPAAEQAAPSQAVPQTQIQFGAQQTVDVQQTGAAGHVNPSHTTQAGATSAPAEAPPKRKRATKAEMEARRAAEAAAASQGNAATGAATVPTADQGGQNVAGGFQLGGMNTAQATQEVQQQTVQTVAQPTVAVNTAGAPNVADLLSKWAQK